VHELDDRRVVGGLVEVDDLRLAGARVLVDGLLYGDVELVEPLDERAEVAPGGDGGADLEAGHHRDVVDGQDVGGIDHRHEQRALVDVGDRDGLVAARGRGADRAWRPPCRP